MSDITLHIDNDLDPVAHNSLNQALAAQSGVEAILSDPRAPHMMVVKYNMQQTSSQDILHHVTDRGFQAELIGL